MITFVTIINLQKKLDIDTKTKTKQ